MILLREDSPLQKVRNEMIDVLKVRKPDEGRRSRADELKVNKREIEASRLKKYYSVFAISSE